ncbi:protein FAR1-RELATED SEQUENCE 5-like [Spinacia oleracea]|uniref:Protein FAR1-RELATED SEQUENCE 5-like n=1 Tax=Spinacia oleracea TaxID=3562 RepID=A0ABM3RH25_SPIOL|nr:protein FAR1-RELATED SEQUENCE 5-like [Spinacia oleracea]
MRETLKLKSLSSSSNFSLLQQLLSPPTASLSSSFNNGGRFNRFEYRFKSRAIEEKLYNYDENLENHREVYDVEDEDEGTSQQVMVANQCIEEGSIIHSIDTNHNIFENPNNEQEENIDKELDGSLIGEARKTTDEIYDLYCKHAAIIDPEFFFRVRLNAEGKVECLFWRDSMMREDYKIYGDVLVFDTTFRTNKYNLICAPFVGINNHWKNTMFACAFIGDETTESFVWVFETFLKAMGGKHPISIFTDQDADIAAGIEQVFPSSRHRLCLWHLSKNANSRFGLLKSDKNFKNAFYKCLSGCITPNDFEETWKSMINTFKLEKDDWFNRLYGLKEKWCTALSKDFFSADILSSQRSESTNHAVGFKANKSTTLTEFYSIFQATINRWRKTEEKDDFDCTRGIPTSELSMSAILKQAANVYTITLFRDFEEEFKLSVASSTMFKGSVGRTMFFEVWIEGITGSRQEVQYKMEDSTVTCTCKNFEESGWLCFHCLRILHLHSINTIPDRYITTRWTRYAKKQIWERVDTIKREKGEINNFTGWRLHMIRRYYNLILKGHKIAKARKFIEEKFKMDNKAVDEIIKKEEERKAKEEAAKIAEQEKAKAEAQRETQDGESTNSEITIVLDPDRANTKGKSKKRIKGQYDNYKQPSKKGKKKHKEF